MIDRFVKTPISMFSAIAFVLSVPSATFGAAIIGGQDSGNPYAALVSSTGATTPLSGSALPQGAGEIISVAINQTGYAIIGGTENGTKLYAALVSPQGATTALSGPAAPVGDGAIYSVAINESGNGIIGGQDGGGTTPYAALVSSSGTRSALFGPAAPTGTGIINAVGISNGGSAIIGGQDSLMAPYAAMVSASGNTTALSGPAAPVGNGYIYSVAINSSGNAIIGGDEMGSVNPYAVLVSSSGVRTPISGLGTLGSIYSVAIGDSGAGIIGGFNNINTPYAVLVSASGNTTALTGSATPSGNGQINSVAINSFGAAIIGGYDRESMGNKYPYAALVTPSGSTIPISGSALPVGFGQILSVGIGDSGAAIIGGVDQNNTKPYAVLVSPSGATTSLTGIALPLGNGAIDSVAIDELIAPKSFGPGSSFANSFFALASQILPNHLRRHNGLIERTGNPQELPQEIGLLASADDQFPMQAACEKQPTSSLWGAGFGEYVHVDKVQNIPTITNSIAGAIIGYDYLGIQNSAIGIAAAYAFNYAHLSGSLGHAKINQEFLTLYGSWYRKNFYLNAALWGGLYQMDNTRHSIANITSTADVDGWLFLPHLEMSFPFFAKEDWFLIDPFLMFDWANNWQGDIHEKGISGFNLEFSNRYTSVLRSEVGFRFFENLQYEWGSLILQEKASYVNKKPFEAGTVPTFFVGSVSSFAVDMFCNQTQNLGVFQMNIEFIPCDPKYPYGSLNYQGEFGSSFQLNLVSFEIGKDF